MKLIVGLGNPGKQYVNTRHNIGYIVVDNFVDNLSWSRKFDGLFALTTINGVKVGFLKPETFMNNSGNSVVKAVNYYGISLNDVLIIRDDLDIPFDTFKLKFDSSSGGHNGIKSIINNLNSQQFCQFKVGISSTLNDVKDYVLGDFSKTEKDCINNKLSLYNEIINYFILNDIEKTMSKYNSR